MPEGLIELNNGQQMPQVGFGCWKVNQDTCADQVYNAIKAGYRLLDAACDYGNEVECGQGLARAIADGLVKREDIFVTSKIWPTFYAPEHVEEACKKQLADWKLSYFDLYLLHFPIPLAYVPPSTRYPPGWAFDGADDVRPGTTPLHVTWAAMESLVTKKLTRSIGVSNFQGSLLLDLLRSATIRPAVLQIEHHPYLAQPALLALARQEGLAVTAYSSFGPASFVELGFKKAAKIPPLMENVHVKLIAKMQQRSPAQVLLRWATQRGVAVVPKSNDPARLKENLDVLGWQLSEGEMEDLDSLDRGCRFNDPWEYLGALPIFA
ncbi:MAG: NAD(P)H-dependent D-xylose reductase (XR) [Trizodia sp. TS-e1964]|nr:MAG: NAD(P)H-dependent D-xylose reductase (XR) [Trizodia sp. TS-e1964]